MLPSILEMQFFQLLHDQDYHSDINTMSTMGKLNHLNNHLIKYMINPVSVLKTTQDQLACLLSMANTIKLDIAKHAEKREQLLYTVNDYKDMWVSEQLHVKVTTGLKDMAKIIEGYDHVESIDTRNLLADCICTLLEICFQVYRESTGRTNGGLFNDWLKRLTEVKKQNPFHPYLHSKNIHQYPIYKSIDLLNMNG